MKRDTVQTNNKLHQIFYNEVEIMKQLDHPHILKLYDHSDKSHAVKAKGGKIDVNYLALEYADGGELFDYISMTGKFTEEQARYFFHQIIDALEYMHDKGYAHRDIKPENILFDSRFDIKLADLGFATNQTMCKSRKGTFGYMAPELLAGKEYNSFEADIFAAGVILFVLITQHPPFVRADLSDRYYKRICHGNKSTIQRIFREDDLSDEFVDMFTKMINYNSEERLSLAAIKEHDWYNGPLPSQDEIFKDFLKRQKVLISKKKKESSKKKTTKSKKRKLTKYYFVNDADELVSLVVQYALCKNYKFVKSEEYFRVELTI